MEHKEDLLQRRQALKTTIQDMLRGDQAATLRVAKTFDRSSEISTLIMEVLADDSYVPAMVALAQNLIKSRNDQDWEKGKEWFHKAADHENADALYWLGTDALENAKGVGGKKKIPFYEGAVRYFQRAGVQQHAGSLYQLGLLFASGKGIDQSSPKALNCYNLAETVATSQRDTSLMVLIAKAKQALAMTPAGREAAKSMLDVFTENSQLFLDSPEAGTAGTVQVSSVARPTLG